MGESKQDLKKITVVTHEEPKAATPPPEPEPDTKDMNANFSWTTGFSLSMNGEKLPREFLIMWILTLIVVIFGISMKYVFQF